MDLAISVTIPEAQTVVTYGVNITLTVKTTVQRKTLINFFNKSHPFQAIKKRAEALCK